MPETALLINPSRRRRRSGRRRARRNPLSRALANLNRGKRRRGGRRRYRRNPGFFFGGHFTIAHAAGAGAYGVLKNGVRRLYWNNKGSAERPAAVAKFNSHSPFVKAGIVAAGWALRAATNNAKWHQVGEGIMLAGLADGIETLTENLGLTPEEKSEKEARKAAQQALQGAGMLVNSGSLASVLVERERQLRAADDDELDELDPNDVFDDVNDDDFEADEDELY